MSDGRAPGAEEHGHLPEPLPPRLQGVAGANLPPGALLSFASIGRGKGVETNHIAVLEPDGRIFVAFHDGSSEAPDVPVMRDLPQHPTHTVPIDDVERIVQLLRDEAFPGEDAYQRSTVEDGEYIVLRARIDGLENEVVYDGLSTPAIDHLRRWASRAPG